MSESAITGVGNVLVDAGLHRPAAFAGINHVALDRRQIRLFLQRVGRKLQQP